MRTGELKETGSIPFFFLEKLMNAEMYAFIAIPDSLGNRPFIKPGNLILYLPKSSEI